MFFENYGIEISDTKLELPEGGFTVDGAAAPEDFPLVYDEEDTQCDGEDARLTVVVWEDHLDPGSSQVYTSSFDDIPFDKNGLAITIAFVPDDVDVEMPPSAANLEDLGALDSPPPAAGETVPASETASTVPTGAAARADGKQRADRQQRASDDHSEHRHHRGVSRRCTPSSSSEDSGRG